MAGTESNRQINKGRQMQRRLNVGWSVGSGLADVVAPTNAGSERVKTGNEDNKKRAAFFLSCSFFGGKWSVERREERTTGTAQRNKENDRRETA
ncbi:hypothetical protein BWK59_12020 [Flavobacterium davisii]|uniref:Uncharacterized protein n=1 Tax=Flavobacterium davisii TaxID=2906077 RepID=A0A246GGB3_9FLAO|nr:hypothetical protein BWK59_12020 [Flavobacterium davisii]